MSDRCFDDGETKEPEPGDMETGVCPNEGPTTAFTVDDKSTDTDSVHVSREADAHTQALNDNKPDVQIDIDLELDPLENNQEGKVMEKVIPDKILLDLDLEHGSMPLEPEVSRVLDTFNSILEDIELLEVGTGDYDPVKLRAALSEGQREYLANTMEAFSELLIGGESPGGGSYEKDLLIVVDDNSTTDDTESDESSCEDNNGPDDECDNDHSGEVLEEGYESDRPMVRSSMRKLRPVQLVPMPMVPVTSPSSGNQLQVPVLPSAAVGYGAGAGHRLLTPSPSLNNSNSNVLLVTSLMNNVMANMNMASASEPPSLEDNNAIDIESSSGGSGSNSNSENNSASGSGSSLSVPGSSQGQGSSGPYTYNQSAAAFQVSSERRGEVSSSQAPLDDGCPSFRPAANLVFRNLHVNPVEMGETFR
jgi:hypothetical protein